MFNLTVTKLNDVVFNGEATSLTVPGTEGEMTILKNHVPLVSGLKKGKITIRKKDSEEIIDIERGIIEVSKNETLVFI